MPMPLEDAPLPERWRPGGEDDALAWPDEASDLGLGPPDGARGAGLDMETSADSKASPRAGHHSTHALARLLSEVMAVHEREVSGLRSQLNTLRRRSREKINDTSREVSSTSVPPLTSPRRTRLTEGLHPRQRMAMQPKPQSELSLDAIACKEETESPVKHIESADAPPRRSGFRRLSERFTKGPKLKQSRSAAQVGQKEERSTEVSADTMDSMGSMAVLTTDVGGGISGQKRQQARRAAKKGTSSVAAILYAGSETDGAQVRLLERFVDGPFDRFCSIWIVLNVVFVCFQLEYYGYGRGVEFDVPPAGLWPWPEGDDFFLITEHVFNAFFLAELVLRILVFRSSFVMKRGQFQKANVFDFVLVSGSSLDLYYAGGNNESQKNGGLNLNVLRPFRFLRLLRTLRVLQTVKIFEKLRELVTTVIASFMALFWSIVLLTIVMLMASLFLCQSLTSTLDDPTVKRETREWSFLMYGTTSRSFYTVFELTFSGGWPNYARTLVEDVHWAFAVFFFLYIIAVTFAMFRIITTLFLRDTLAVASNDAEAAVQEKMKQREGYAAKLLDFFYAADESGDGYLTLDEFEAILADERVKTWLSLMDIDVHETEDFFSVLADGDGLVSAEEFVQGILRLKGNARSQDVMAIQRSTRSMQNLLATLLELCAQMDTDIRFLKKQPIVQTVLEREDLQVSPAPANAREGR